jgi:hypothetical protein
MRSRLSYYQKATSSLVTVAAICVGLNLAAAASFDVLGNLETRGPVNVKAPEVSTPVAIADTTYAYVSGDHIATGKGSAILTIPDVGRFGFMQETEGTVERPGRRIEVALKAGTLAYSVQLGTDLRIEAAGIVLTPAAKFLRPVSDTVGGQGALLNGWIAVGEDGVVSVSVDTGRVTVYHGATWKVVEGGTKESFHVREGRLVPVVFEAIRGKFASLGTTGTVMAAAAAVAVVGGGLRLQPQSGVARIKPRIKTRIKPRIKTRIKAGAG